MKKEPMAGMSHKTARKTAPIKKSVTKIPGKKATEKVMAKPKENKVRNPENKVVWKPFMR